MNLLSIAGHFLSLSLHQSLEGTSVNTATFLGGFRPDFATGRISMAEPLGPAPSRLRNRPTATVLRGDVLTPATLGGFSRAVSAIFQGADELKKRNSQPAGGWRIESCEVRPARLLPFGNRDFPKWEGQLSLASETGAFLSWDIRPMGSPSVFRAGLSAPQGGASASHSVGIDFERKRMTNGRYQFSTSNEGLPALFATLGLPASSTLLDAALASALQVYLSGQFSEKELAGGLFVRHWQWFVLSKQPRLVPLLLGENGFQPAERIDLKPDDVTISSEVPPKGKPLLFITGHSDAASHRRSLTLELANDGRADEGPRPLAVSLQKLFWNL